MMTQYQTDEEYFEYPIEDSDDDYAIEYNLDNKRKHLANRDYERGYEPARYSERSRPVDIVAWGVTGVVGFALTVGSIIVAANSPESWVMLIPLVYMLASMWMLRRR